MDGFEEEEGFQQVLPRRSSKSSGGKGGRGSGRGSGGSTPQGGRGRPSLDKLKSFLDHLKSKLAEAKEQQGLADPDAAVEEEDKDVSVQGPSSGEMTSWTIPETDNTEAAAEKEVKDVPTQGPSTTEQLLKEMGTLLEKAADVQEVNVDLEEFCEYMETAYTDLHNQWQLAYDEFDALQTKTCDFDASSEHSPQTKYMEIRAMIRGSKFCEFNEDSDSEETGGDTVALGPGDQIFRAYSLVEEVVSAAKISSGDSGTNITHSWGYLDDIAENLCAQLELSDSILMFRIIWLSHHPVIHFIEDLNRSYELRSLSPRLRRYNGGPMLEDPTVLDSTPHPKEFLRATIQLLLVNLGCSEPELIFILLHASKKDLDQQLDIINQCFASMDSSVRIESYTEDTDESQTDEQHNLETTSSDVQEDQDEDSNSFPADDVEDSDADTPGDKALIEQLQTKLTAASTESDKLWKDLGSLQESLGRKDGEILRLKNQVADLQSHLEGSSASVSLEPELDPELLTAKRNALASKIKFSKAKMREGADPEGFLLGLHGLISSDACKQFIIWRPDGNGFMFLGGKSGKDQFISNVLRRHGWTAANKLTQFLAINLGFKSAGPTDEWRHEKNWFHREHPELCKIIPNGFGRGDRYNGEEAERIWNDEFEGGNVFGDLKEVFLKPTKAAVKRKEDSDNATDEQNESKASDDDEGSHS